MKKYIPNKKLKKLIDEIEIDLKIEPLRRGKFNKDQLKYLMLLGRAVKKMCDKKYQKELIKLGSFIKIGEFPKTK